MWHVGIYLFLYFDFLRRYDPLRFWSSYACSNPNRVCASLEPGYLILDADDLYQVLSLFSPVFVLQGHNELGLSTQVLVEPNNVGYICHCSCSVLSGGNLSIHIHGTTSCYRCHSRTLSNCAVSFCSAFTSRITT